MIVANWRQYFYNKYAKSLKKNLSKNNKIRNLQSMFRLKSDQIVNIRKFLFQTINDVVVTKYRKKKQFHAEIDTRNESMSP